MTNFSGGATTPYLMVGDKIAKAKLIEQQNSQARGTR